MKPIQKILTDLVKHIENEEPIHKHEYSYDRMDWVKKNLSKQDDLYDIGLENLRVLVYQLSLFNQHILTDENGKEINKKPRRNNEE